MTIPRSCEGGAAADQPFLARGLVSQASAASRQTMAERYGAGTPSAGASQPSALRAQMNGSASRIRRDVATLVGDPSTEFGRRQALACPLAPPAGGVAPGMPPSAGLDGIAEGSISPFFSKSANAMSSVCMPSRCPVCIIDGI